MVAVVVAVVVVGFRERRHSSVRSLSLSLWGVPLHATLQVVVFDKLDYCATYVPLIVITTRVLAPITHSLTPPLPPLPPSD